MCLESQQEKKTVQVTPFNSSPEPQLPDLQLSVRWEHNPSGPHKSRQRAWQLGLTFAVSLQAEIHGLKVLGFIWKSLQLTLQPMSTQNALFAIYWIFSCQEISQTSDISCTLRKLLIFASKLSPQLLRRLRWAVSRFQQTLPYLSYEERI